VNLRSLYLTGAVTLAGQVLLGLWALTQVEPGAEVPIHWDVNGVPNGWGPPIVAFFLMPAITAGVLGLFALIPRIEPRRGNLLRSASAYRTVGIAVVLLMGLMQVMIVTAALELIDLSVATITGVAVGVLFVLLGNVLGTVRSNYMFGVRTPWTLTSDLAWAKTHRLLGRMFFALGVALVVVSLGGWMQAVVGVIIGGTIAILVVAMVYSYRVWKTDPDRRDHVEEGVS
jgi:uncharacterized membrane protein